MRAPKSNMAEYHSCTEIVIWSTADTESGPCSLVEELEPVFVEPTMRKRRVRVDRVRIDFRGSTKETSVVAVGSDKQRWGKSCWSCGGSCGVSGKATKSVIGSPRREL